MPEPRLGSGTTKITSQVNMLYPLIFLRLLPLLASTKGSWREFYYMLLLELDMLLLELDMLLLELDLTG